jgi:hypothetical protein
MANTPQERSNPPEIPHSFERLPMQLPPRLAELLGYCGRARFVAFYWEQVGDELMFDDGQSEGTAEWFPFKRLVEHPRVAPLIFRYDFGSSDCEAMHWLIVDRHRSQAYAATVADARTFLGGQHPHRPPLTEEQSRSLEQEISRLAQQLPDEARLRAIDAFAQKQRRHVEHLVRFLDRLPLPRR